MESTTLLIFFLIFLILILVFLLSTIYPFKKLFINATDGISVIKNNKIIDCNDSLVKLFGYKNKKAFLDVHPLKLSPLHQPDGLFSLTKAEDMFDIAKKNKNVTFDWVFLDSDGNEKWIEINIIQIQPFSIFQKEIYFMIWKNINQRKKIEDDLKELNTHLEELVEKKTKELGEREHMLFFQSKQAQMGEMISMIAHQWRQPLASISATAIGLKMKLHFKKTKSLHTLDEEFLPYLSEQLDDIETYTQVLTTTIDDFRDFYRPQKAKYKSNLNTTILKAYNIIQGTLKSSDIQVDFTLESKKEMAHYQGEIIHVFLNLFNNAIEHFEEKSTKKREIHIVSKDSQDGVILSFCDSGGGIPLEYLDKIFSPYFTTKENGLGTGLGLYMSKKILSEHHNGDIKIHNSDIGACFVMEIR